MNIKEYLKNQILYLDGATGTLLQKAGLPVGELPERWNITHPEILTKLHLDYYNAGSNVVSANTFGANCLKFSDTDLEEIIKAALQNVQNARMQSTYPSEKWVAFDIGPTGRMLAPYGDLSFDEAVSIFAKSIKLAVKYGAEIIFIQTMNDSYETKAALLAAKENCDLPVFVTNAYNEDAKLMTGANPAAMIAMLEGMGADAIGINCSLGPKDLEKAVDEYIKYASVPIILKPNAGLPKSVNGETVYDISAEEFSQQMKIMVEKGVNIAGGCCGTTPEYIEKLVMNTKDIAPVLPRPKNITFVSSYTHAVIFGDKPILIGERINPTGKKLFKQALLNNDIDYILKEGINQQEKGVDIIDVNVGLPEIDEVKTLDRAVFELQSVIDLPLQIDTSDKNAMQIALRHYNGKAMINSVNGKQESMDAVFPLAKKYGGLIVALTLDENGIPNTAKGRLDIAKKIINEAKKYDIDKKDIIFDPLALSVSADKTAAIQTLLSVELIEKELGCHTSLGISNVSFGLPKRNILNSTFFALALSKGLSAAIMNPYATDMMQTYYGYLALSGKDENFENYIDFAKNIPELSAQVPQDTNQKQNTSDECKSQLQSSIVKGLKEQTSRLTKELLKTVNPLEIIENEVIPALNIVGVGFEEKRVYLPQLLMSAEAAKCAFEEVKLQMSGDKTSNKGDFVIATVKGDIHDIGKNIVRLLLENFGFNVIDLGKDVDPEDIVNETVKRHAPLVGLSALMTTTVSSMEETIKSLKKDAPWCKIVVGGAVLNKEYADSIGADKYAKDAMETVRYAEEMMK